MGLLDHYQREQERRYPFEAKIGCDNVDEHKRMIDWCTETFGPYGEKWSCPIQSLNEDISVRFTSIEDMTLFVMTMK